MDKDEYWDKLGYYANWAMIKRIELPADSKFHVADPNGYLMLTEIYEKKTKCPVCKKIKDKRMHISYRRHHDKWYLSCDACPSISNVPLEETKIRFKNS